MRAKFTPRIRLENRPPLAELIPLATPLVVFVDPATACNFRCTFCPTGHADLVARRFNGLMSWELYRKVIDDMRAFDAPVKVLRLYKDGEPLLNKHFADMVWYAKRAGVTETIDTTTNGVLLTPKIAGPAIDAGLDRINISIDGMSDGAYAATTKARVRFENLVANVRWVYEHRGNCKIHVKALREAIEPAQEPEFFATFGDICDEIFIENFSPCWPEFDGETRTGWRVTRGLYGQPLQNIDVCPYIFYTYCVNSDGLVSACSVDWARKLIIGDVRRESMRDIWLGDKAQELRRQHLRGERKNREPCASCHQLSNCMADNIDAHREQLLERFA